MSSAANIQNFETPSAVSSLIDVGARTLVTGHLRQITGLRAGLLPGQKIIGLALPLSSLHVGDKQKASAFYHGKFKFFGEQFLRTENNVFAEQGMSSNWQKELHRFAWLADMQACGRELSRGQARALILEWISLIKTPGFSRWTGQAYKSDVLARRIISWVQYAPFLLKGCSEDFSGKFYASIRQQAGWLYRRAHTENNGLKRLQANIALTYAIVGFEGLESLRAKTFERLAGELDRQILADGGHISRNPQVLRDLLADLVPIRMALEAKRLEVPAAMNAALERMLPALRFFTYMDGGLAVFNGVNDTRAGLTRRILETDAVCGRPLSDARHSGYMRLQQGNSTIMIDTGKPTMPSVNTGATAGVLAFEFCDASARLVTNCGAVACGDEAWSSASRSTQAHSSLCLDDQPVGKILEGSLLQKTFGGAVVLSVPNVFAKAQTSHQGAVFTGSHDGYEKSHGIVHERQLFLNGDGHDFRGQDSFINSLDGDGAGNFGQDEPVPFAIRFHLHPSVRATISQDGASAMLLLANKTGWRFSARGAQLKLEDSVYLPEDGRVRKTSQLILRGFAGQTNKVMWAFKRIEKRKGAKLKSVEPQLL